MALYLCKRRDRTLAIFISVFVPDKGWNSGYIHGTLCKVMQEKCGTLAIFMALCEGIEGVEL